MAIEKIADIADPRRREQLRRHQREYARLKTRLREIGFICEGTLLERWMRCGKANCVCARSKARWHGPYFELSWKRKGKTVSRRLSSEEASLYRQWVANRQRLQSIIGEMQQVSQKAQRHLLHAKRSPKVVAKPRDIVSSSR